MEVCAAVCLQVFLLQSQVSESILIQDIDGTTFIQETFGNVTSANSYDDDKWKIFIRNSVDLLLVIFADAVVVCIVIKSAIFLFAAPLEPENPLVMAPRKTFFFVLVVFYD